MSARFATAAGRLAGLVPRALGWRPADFWAATPAELAAIRDHASEREDAPLTRGEFDRLRERDRDG